MNHLVMEKTASTPAVDFDPDTCVLRIAGESFPENAAKFYAPILAWIGEFTERPGCPAIVLECDILYFNSSTSKILMNLFDTLESCVLKGKDIAVRWFCREDNETAVECGEEFREDLDSLPFEIVLRKD